MNTDYQLRQDVLDELDFEPSVEATHIGVSAHHGVVTLNGFVGSYAQKLAAERAVRRVRGVKAIAEEITVRLPSDKHNADEEIAARALDILKWRVGLPANGIGVKVEHGTVTLTGQVDHNFQRNDAAAAIAHLSGVALVLNEIELKPSVHASDVRAKIEKALERSAELDASRITVQTEGGKVILAGSVKAWFERGLAEQAAWAAPGVTEVRDHIDIQP